MLKVVHIEDRFHPEMGYQVNFFAKYHNPLYRFYIITSKSLNIWQADPSDKELMAMDNELNRKYGITVIRLKARLASPSRNNIWLVGLNRVIRDIGPDIIYTHVLESYSSIRVLFCGRNLKRSRLLFDTHTLRNQFQKSLKFKLYLMAVRILVVRRINNQGLKVFGTVPENIRILEEDYGIQSKNIGYLPIGTDLELFRHDARSRMELRNDLSIADKEMVLLYAGKLNAKKNPHLILEALQKIETQVDFPLHCIFIGHQVVSYTEQYMQVGYHNKKIQIYFLPAVPANQLFRWYSMADIAVFPSENTLTSMDAQACRLPVIMEDDPTNRERLQKGGIVYMKQNIADLAQKIYQLLTDSSLRKKLGREGSSFMNENYDYRRITRQLEEEMGLGDLSGT